MRPPNTANHEALSSDQEGSNEDIQTILENQENTSFPCQQFFINEEMRSYLYLVCIYKLWSDGSTMGIDWDHLPETVFLKGGRDFAYRDPCAHYHDGTFRVWHTQIHGNAGGDWVSGTGVTESTDLIHWSEPRLITPLDKQYNYSSPGNVIRYNNRWMMCLQTYPTPNGGFFGDESARIFTMVSDDLIKWDQPKLIRVKGPNIARKDMGRMIDPYLIEDKDQPGKWWCFFKQNGASMSWSTDLNSWTYYGHVEAGENVCLLIDENNYVLFHSPNNGVGVKRSQDFQTWTDHGLLTLGQAEWPWAQGRLTAGHVLDLRDEEAVGKYVMFFHGSSPEGCALQETHGHSSLAFAWSPDLASWEWCR